MDVTNRTHLNILVVDDDIGAANALGRLLRACGHTVHVSYSSPEGLELARRVKPDLILHDITMPLLDGYEAARRLREMPLLSGALLIACSGSVDEAKARDAGFDGWLVKPISNGELDTVLALVLRRVNQISSNSESDIRRDAPE
jgi:CheY-like chemotaxis protein